MRTAVGARYRWLSVGQRVRYVGRESITGLRGHTGVVLAVPDYKSGGPKNVSVRLDVQLPALGPLGPVQTVHAPAGVWRAE